MPPASFTFVQMHSLQTSVYNGLVGFVLETDGERAKVKMPGGEVKSFHEMNLVAAARASGDADLAAMS